MQSATPNFPAPFPLARFRSQITTSHVIAGMFMAVFKGELGDAGFVEVADVFLDHTVVLFLGGACERQIESEIAREFESDPAVFGGVCSGEKAAVLAILHVFAVGFEHARVRAGLRENLAKHR
jgi:hypothetical protein